MNRITLPGPARVLSDLAMRFDRQESSPIVALATTAPGAGEAAGEGDRRQAIAEFIRTRGVTRCPTACLAPTQAAVDPADRAALAEYALKREERRAARAAGRTVPPS
jgi:hypothetical protein